MAASRDHLQTKDAYAKLRVFSRKQPCRRLSPSPMIQPFRVFARLGWRP